MDAWKQIAANALVGTERQSFTPPIIEGKLGRAMEKIAGDSAAEKLLACIAITANYGRVASEPPEWGAELPPPAPEQVQSVCAPEAGARLLEILEGESGGVMREVLGEWLALVARAGKAVVFQALPALLEAGSRDRALRDLVLPVLGERGRWLAGLNPEWAYGVSGEDDEKVWDEGHVTARIALMKSLRMSNPDRAAFLSLVAEGLTPEDESFLESALDDRSKEVRRIAADLLSRLPQSAFSTRMRARAVSVLKIETKLFRKHLAVETPDDFDDAAKRDGLGDDKPDLSTLGDKGIRLYAAIASAPLECWDEALKIPPEELIEMARKTDWELAIHAGWAAAARRQRNKKWILALINDQKSKGRTFSHQELMDALDEGELEADALRCFSRGDGWGALLARAGRIKAPWSAALTEAVLTGLLKELASKGNYDYTVAQELLVLGQRGNPELFPKAEAGAGPLAESQSHWANSIEKFLAIYSFRNAMYKEVQL
ncbi:hypothetical protein HYR69_01295 [Candidatus Sumerlaeota bacterium]|nr:hypothetical protein [Candidatus Sumerlaeota bacterium]MBI3735670.1 hypothetical protein [Candidatus Sumerlaeota bacterium]